MSQFKLYTRADCGLCEEMYSELIELGISAADVEFVDIDQRPELRALYGAKIPVLEKAGVELAAGRLTDQSLLALRP